MPARIDLKLRKAVSHRYLDFGLSRYAVHLGENNQLSTKQEPNCKSTERLSTHQREKVDIRATNALNWLAGERRTMPTSACVALAHGLEGATQCRRVPIVGMT